MPAKPCIACTEAFRHVIAGRRRGVARASPLGDGVAPGFPARLGLRRHPSRPPHHNLIWRPPPPRRMSWGMVRASTWMLLAAAVMLAPAPVGAADRALTVVELFTSQGCSSCPPADKFLGELAPRHDLLALSFHVDYWDYIGWKDPFASPAHTQRQRDYAQRLGLRYVYTPQMVIQGTVQATGSNRAAVLAAIAGAPGAGHVSVGLRRDGRGRVVVSVSAAPTDGDVDVWMVVYDREHVTRVKRGENRGRTITNRNVVRALGRIATWRGQPLEVTAVLADIGVGGDACAVILQSQRNGRILGAAKLALDAAH